MSALPDPTAEEAASALGRLLHEGEARPAGRESDAELTRLLRAASEARVEQPRTVRRAWVLAAAVATILVVFVGLEWRKHAATELTFFANGVPGRERTALVAEAGRAIDLAFSDGSVFNVEPAARLRVESSSPNGARLTLLEGKTLAQVVHRAKSSWSVAAGPFEVRVTGTRFGASWDAANERLSVELYDGSVQVVGGALATPIAVRAGQRLEAGKGAGNWLLTSLEGPAGPLGNAKRPAASAASSDPPMNAPAPSTATARAVSPVPDWSALLARADFEGILRQADEMGVERCFSTCASADLRMLADSARYLGRHALAERSLLALRKRSPSDAASAAFLLARLEEGRDPRKALSWYEKSLAEAPSGAYAAEALAGKMHALLQTGGATAAAPAAEQYLRRFPSGVYAAKARDVLSRVPR
jgi:hypothetical protein